MAALTPRPRVSGARVVAPTSGREPAQDPISATSASRRAGVVTSVQRSEIGANQVEFSKL